MWGLWSLLLACSGGEEELGDGCAVDPAPTVAIGTGEGSFEPMPDEVVLVHGNQGGYHVTVAFDATGLDSSDTIHFLVEGTIDDEVVAVADYYAAVTCNAETASLQAWGGLLIYPLTPPELDNQPTTISATLTDAAGAEASTTASTTIVDPLLD